MRFATLLLVAYIGGTLTFMAGNLTTSLLAIHYDLLRIEKLLKETK